MTVPNPSQVVMQTITATPAIRHIAASDDNARNDGTGKRLETDSKSFSMGTILGT